MPDSGNFSTMQSNYEPTLVENQTEPSSESNPTDNFTSGSQQPTQSVPSAEDSEEFSQAEKRPREATTCLSLYLTEIGKVKLLTPEQEIELANRVKQGDEEARELMIKSNLRLVVKIAREYEGIGLPLMDLISEGNIGLIKAVERFDPTRGAKLSTYSVWWIKQSIRRALANQSKTIRLPVHMVSSISRMHRVGRLLNETLGREPTDEEVGNELGVKASRVAQMRVAAIRPASLDAKIGAEDSSTLGDVVQDENAEAPYQRFECESMKRMLRESVEKLDRREAAIITSRYGLDGGHERTLEEVAEQFGVTRERVRQIQEKALTKLRKKIERLEMADI
jgi:RNA polymerase primary sigma factor